MKRNLSWLLIGNGLYSFSQFVTLIIITKFLGISDLGLYSLSLSIVAPIALFSTFQIKTIISTEGRLEKEKVNSYLLTRAYSLIIGALLTLTFAILLNYKSILGFLILFYLIKLIESFSDIYFGYYHKYGLEKYIGTSLVIRSFMSITSFIIGGILYKSLYLALIINVLLLLIRYLFIEKKIFNKVFNFEKDKLNISMSWEIIKAGLPLGIASLLVSLNTNIPRIMLEKQSDTYSLGIFTSLIYFITITNIFFSAIMQFMLPRFNKAIQFRNTKVYNKYILSINALIFLTSITLFIIFKLWGHELLTLIYNEEVAGALDLMNFVIIYGIVGFFNFLNNTLLNAKRKFNVQPIILSATTVVIVISSYFFIKEYDISGALYSLIISSLFNLLLSSVFLFFSKESPNE